MSIKNRIPIKNLSSSRLNNFDFIRFIASSIVVVSHSFPLSYGDNNKEILSVLTNDQITLGKLAVKIFFIISGYLIAQSWDNTKDIIKFLKARILRIFPAIIVVIILSVVLIGAVFTTHSLSNYFSNPKTYQYLQSITLFKMQYNLPGVFENNVYKNAVNGSLWTLEYEFACYLVIAILGVTKLLKKKSIVILFIIVYILDILQLGDNQTQVYLIQFLVQFLLGTLCYIYRDIIRLKFSYVMAGILLLVISSLLGALHVGLMLFLPYIIMYIAFCPKIKLHHFASKGDLSYGIYIYAFPIQQIVVHLNGGNMQWYMNFIIAFPIILLCSYISWHLVEKPCMKLKYLNLKQSTVWLKKTN